MDKIHIVCVTDDNYAQHLGVMFISLFKNKKSRSRVKVYLIDGGISEVNKKKLVEIIYKNYAEIEFLQIDKKMFEGMAVKNHMSHAAYYKVSIPNILSEDIKKVLFLDCDLIVKEDITKLWEIDVEGKFVYAVENPMFDRYDQLAIPQGSLTFNSGVMLIDLESWRKSNISEQVIEFLKENSAKISLHDQDGFNAILYDRWIAAPPKWNQQTKFFEISYKQTKFNKKEFELAKKQPAIIHYTTSSKPWQYSNVHPYKKQYYKYLELSPWTNYQPQDKNLRALCKKISLKILPNVMKARLRKFYIEYLK